MAQPQSQQGQLPLKSITLTIIPQTATVPVNTQEEVIPVKVSTSPYAQGTIPNFNHVPITPVIIPTPAAMPKPVNHHELTLEEKEARRLEKQRLAQSRYRDKTKPYTELASIPGDASKVAALLKLSFPQLNNVNPYVLESEVNNFIAYVTRQRA